MQPTRLKGFNYQPIALPATQDPWAGVRASMSLQKQLEEEQKRMEAEAAKNKRGSGNQSWLSSLISELGGAGGAAGGAAIGTAIAPGVGTLIGAGLGGFFGGTGGRLAENQIRDNEMRLGDALKEGALSGAFSTVGAGIQGFRGAAAIGKAGGANVGTRAATGFGTIANMSDDAAKAAAKKAIWSGGKKGGQNVVRGLSSGTDDLAKFLGYGPKGMGSLKYTGTGMQKNAVGIGTGAKAKGIERIGSQQGDDLLRFMSENGLPVDSPEKVERGLKPMLNQWGKKLSSAYGKKAAIDDDTLIKASDVVRDRVMKDPSIGELSGAGKKLFDKQLKLFVNANNSDDMWKFKKGLDPLINYAGNTEGKTIEKEIIARLFRDKADEILGKVVPEVAEFNTKYSTGSTLNKLLLEASKPADRSGLWSRIFTSEAVRGGEGKLGSVLSGIGSATGSQPVKVGAGIGKGVVARGIGNQMFGAGGQPVPEQPMNSEVMPLGNPFGTDVLSTPGGLPGALGGGMQQQSNSPFAPQNMESAIAQILSQGGDFGDVKDYLAIAEVVNELQGGSKATGPNITKVTGQQYQLAQRGMSTLDQLEQLLASDPNVLDRAATPGRKLPIVGGFISDAAGTGDFDAMSYNVASALLRIETGAQANPEEIKNLQSQLMPRAGDSPQTVQTKLAQLRQAFSGILNTANSNYGGGTDFQSAINQYAPY